MKFLIELTAAQIEIIGQALDEMPFNLVKPLIDAVTPQIIEQEIKAGLRPAPDDVEAKELALRQATLAELDRQIKRKRAQVDRLTRSKNSRTRKA